MNHLMPVSFLLETKAVYSSYGKHIPDRLLTSALLSFLEPKDCQQKYNLHLPPFQHLFDEETVIRNEWRISFLSNFLPTFAKEKMKRKICWKKFLFNDKKQQKIIKDRIYILVRKG